ncbi:MAG: hypothetical protein ACRD0R_23860 [Acidimicrobiales bacterium]
MAKKEPDLIPPQIRVQVTKYVAWLLAAGCFFIPFGLVLAPMVVGLFWLHRWDNRVPAAAVGVAIVGFATNVFVLIGTSSQ